MGKVGFAFHPLLAVFLNVKPIFHFFPDFIDRPRPFDVPGISVRVYTENVAHRGYRLVFVAPMICAAIKDQKERPSSPPVERRGEYMTPPGGIFINVFLCRFGMGDRQRYLLPKGGLGACGAAGFSKEEHPARRALASAMTFSS